MNIIIYIYILEMSINLWYKFERERNIIIDCTIKIIRNDFKKNKKLKFQNDFIEIIFYILNLENI